MALGLFQSLCIALTSGIRFSSNTLSRWLYHLMKYNGPGVRRGIPVPVLPQISCLDLGRLHGFTGFPCGSKGKDSAHHVGDLSSNAGSGSSTGEENGNPLQYSCLENPMDREAWRATVHRVMKSQTRWSIFTFSWIYWTF